jgi:hypothetical protein
VKRFAAVLCLSVLGALHGASTADSYPAKFGMRYLQPPCCSGQPLQGTASSLYVSAITPDSSHCIAFRSDAENQPADYLLQAGLLKCGSSADHNCHINNQLIKWVETEVAGVFTCFAHGTASLNTLYDPVSVINGSGNTWTAYIGSTAYESNSFPQYFITESGEHTGTDSCSGWTGVATFAKSGSLWQWSRYLQSTRSWTIVGSSYISAGCWTVGGPLPGPFDIYHYG